MNRDLRVQDLEKELAESRKKIQSLEGEILSYKKSIEKLKEEIYQFKGLLYSSTSLITFLKGPEYIIEFANDPIRKIWGKGNDVNGKPLFEVVPEVREQGVEEYLTQVYYKGEPYHAEGMPLEHEVNGKMIKSYFDFSYMPQRNSQGEIVGVGVIAQDVTSSEVLNQQIRKSEKEFRELVDFMPHKISIANANGTTLFYNKSWLDYTGLSMEEFIDSHWSAIIHPEQKEKVEKELEECLTTGKNLDIELKILNKDQEYKWHLCRAIALKDEDNIITSWISSSTEIQKLKEEEQRKEDFLKLVSHELKTPVTSIKGYVQLLLSLLKDRSGYGVPVEQSKPYLHRIENQVERLIILISEMLDLSRIEQNELELHKEEFSLNEHVENIIDDMSYTHKDVQIKMEHLCECNVVADKDRIGQVIINFITNALKYSPDSKKVNVKIFHQEKDNVAVSVRDFGIGIDKKDFKKIFNRFYRVSSKNEKTYAGFGIGLYLSSEIIERHKGEIFVQSNIGEGSEFTFTLPLN